MNPAEIKVSVVIPAYNAARYIGETLDSILAQSELALEIIVVDDCSKDETAAVVQRYAAQDRRVRYCRTEKNFGGPAGPRNIGVGMARASLVAFCDSDDLWLRNKVAMQLDLVQREDAPVYCTNLLDFQDGETPDLTETPALNVPVQTFSLLAIALKNRIATSSAMVRRQDVLDAGGFNEARDLVAVEDFDLWLRLIERAGKPAMRLEAPLLRYRRLPGSISANKGKQVVKMLRVMKLFFARRGMAWLIYPAAIPLILTHVLGSIWLRRLHGRT
ncbi:MAG: glycosyltransferase family 2 protein [Beijerinckiaceae bacterium]